MKRIGRSGYSARAAAGAMTATSNRISPTPRIAALPSFSRMVEHCGTGSLGRGLINPGPAHQGECLLPVLCFQRVQGVGIVECGELALGNGLLLYDSLLLVLRAFVRQPLDRLVVPVLGGAVADHVILLGEALLALGDRCIEFVDSGFSIVASGIS